MPYEDRRKQEAKEETVCAMYAALRGQEALLPGVLPGALSEHGMQRDVSRVASPVGVGPSLVALELGAGRTSGGDVEFLSLLLLFSGATVSPDPWCDAPEVRLGHAAWIPRGLQSGLPALGCVPGLAGVSGDGELRAAMSSGWELLVFAALWNLLVVCKKNRFVALAVLWCMLVEGVRLLLCSICRLSVKFVARVSSGPDRCFLELCALPKGSLLLVICCSPRLRV